MDIRIPREALEAGARALLHAETPVTMEWNYSIPVVREEYLDKARAFFTAMVEAWPGMEHEPTDFERWKLNFPFLILPLTEKPDAE